MRQDGYTLLELLVVMLLLGMIGIIIGGGLQFGTTVWQRTGYLQSNSDRIAAAQGILRSALGAAVPVREGGFVRFEGRSDRISFVMPPTGAIAGTGLMRITLDSYEGRLVLKAASPDGTIREAVLAEGLSRLHFAYLDASDRMPAWLDRWTARGRLPDAIRIVQDGASGEWPAFVVHPKISQDANCVFDSVSATCR
jgi:prepilin-type N-terminal cleavage/methylation domain-containing protein